MALCSPGLRCGPGRCASRSGAACGGRRFREGHGKRLCVGSRPCRWRGGHPLRRYGDLYGSCGRAHDVRQSAGDVPRRVADEPERGGAPGESGHPAVLLDEPLRGNVGRYGYVSGGHSSWAGFGAAGLVCGVAAGGAHRLVALGPRAAAGVSRRLLDEPACRRHGASRARSSMALEPREPRRHSSHGARYGASRCS